MSPTPVYGARAEKPLQNADFAMKQTNICRLSGDINKLKIPPGHEWDWHAGSVDCINDQESVQIESVSADIIGTRVSNSS